MTTIHMPGWQQRTIRRRLAEIRAEREARDWSDRMLFILDHAARVIYLSAR